MSLRRIKKNREFKRVYRYGKPLISRNIVLYFCPNQEGINRVGYSISKKVGKSVQRHRIKRVYHEAFRSIQGEIKQGHDFVLVARKSAVGKNYHQAREELLYLCRKGKLINSHYH